jgi:hypothetical protein
VIKITLVEPKEERQKLCHMFYTRNGHPLFSLVLMRDQEVSEEQLTSLLEVFDLRENAESFCYFDLNSRGKEVSYSFYKRERVHYCLIPLVGQKIFEPQKEELRDILNVQRVEKEKCTFREEW